MQRSRRVAERRGEDSYTMPLEVRIKPTTVAEICSWLDSEGQRAMSKSGVIRLAMETFAEMLVGAGKARRYRYTEDALEYLEDMGISGYGKFSAMSRRLHDQLNRESLGRFEQTREASTTANGLLDQNGWLLFSTMQKLSELGYGKDVEFDNKGNGLPAGVMDILRRGEMPPRVEQLRQALDKVETPEEATLRRTQEAAAQKALMKAAIEASKREREKETQEAQPM